MIQLNGYSSVQAREFAQQWLPAWTGNQPEKLLAFYTEDVFYSDPGIPQGVRGKAALLDYFKKLLAKNPEWVWTQTAATPMQDGFVNHWRADIPTQGQIVTCYGVCLVYLHQGLIYQNTVYFDRTPLFQAMGMGR